MARQAKKVYGVEVIPQAVEDARQNARRNGIENVEFYVGKAEEVLPEFYAGIQKDTTERRIAAEDMLGESDQEKRHPDVIVVDPPRKGCDEKCLETMLAMRPQRIVYVSCDPQTLSRDIARFEARGYQLERACPVDMFPQTYHVECVCLLVSR